MERYINMTAYVMIYFVESEISKGTIFVDLFFSTASLHWAEHWPIFFSFAFDALHGHKLQIVLYMLPVNILFSFNFISSNTIMRVYETGLCNVTDNSDPFMSPEIKHRATSLCTFFPTLAGTGRIGTVITFILASETSQS